MLDKYMLFWGAVGIVCISVILYNIVVWGIFLDRLIKLLAILVGKEIDNEGNNPGS